MSLGLLLILSAAALMAYNYMDSNRAGHASEVVMKQLTEIIVPVETVPQEVQGQHEQMHMQIVQQPDYIKFPQMEMPVVTIDERDYVGYLSIPALDLELPILSKWSNSGARVAPCLYSGSVYLDNMVIAGHNYLKHFYALSDLVQGDEIRFTDVEGNVFQFTVRSIEILSATAIEEMRESDWDLTLFTCTYSGADRVTVRCEKN